MASLVDDFIRHDKNCESLRDAFNAGLPKDFRCRIRYVSSPAKPCDPLFSPCPGIGREKTKLASHFLTVSVPAREIDAGDGHGDVDADDQVLVFAMEVLIYSQKGLTTMFVSKADSSGYLPQRKPSPIKPIGTTFLWWLGTRQRQKLSAKGNADARLVISLFARAQSQYLFPGSADHGKKHVLDDRQLIKWWAQVLDPMLPEYRRSGPKAVRQPDGEPEHQGYMTIPGAEIRSFQPSYNTSARAHWKKGNPLLELANARGVPETAPTRCLLPRFPDDPKARFMQDLDDEIGLVEDAGPLASPSKRKSGRWKTIHDLERFWEAMEFRQECSSGRLVGFLWLVIRPSPDLMRIAQEGKAATKENGISTAPVLTSSSSELPDADSQDSQTSLASTATNGSSHKKRRRKGPLTGPIHPRAPRLKGGSSNLSATSNPSQSNASQPNTAQQDGPYLTKEGYDEAMGTLLNLDFSTLATAALSTRKWVAEVSSMSGLGAGDWALDVVGEFGEVVAGSGSSAPGAANDLGGLVRKKKRKVDEGGEEVAATPVEPPQEQQPVVNTLVPRKKAKT